MMKDKIKAAYEELAESYDAHIDHKPHNAYYDRPNTLALMGQVKGKNILDAACGPGKYAEILMAEGATVTGFDLSPTMIDLAIKRNAGRGNFFVHDLAQPFAKLQNESFDIIVCALAMHYVKDWNPVVAEFYRVLKSGGTLVISIEHPFFDYNYFKSERYFDLEEVKATWSGFGKPVEVPCYRRSLQDSIDPIVTSGFVIDKLLEPLPTAEFEKLDPKHFKELNEFPAFMCIRALKK